MCDRKAGVNLNTPLESKPEGMTGMPDLLRAGHTGTGERRCFLTVRKEKGVSRTYGIGWKGWKGQWGR